MNEYEELKKLLETIGVPIEEYGEPGDNYQDICIMADASDKCITISFEDGKYSYSN